MIESISYAPYIGGQLLIAIAVANAALLVIALWLGLRGWFLRGVAAALLLLALANPSLKQEDRTPLSDVVFLLVDETESQSLPDRTAQTARALTDMKSALNGLTDYPVEVVPLVVRDSPDAAPQQGTLLHQTLTEAAAQVSNDRIAGAILLSDGRVHDLSPLAEFPAPVHLLRTGRAEDWDRRLILENAPAFGIVGESVRFTLRIEETGAVPPGIAPPVVLASIDGGTEQRFSVPIGESVTLSMKLDHAGINLLDIRTPAADGEITNRNNRVIQQINGVRDRLRVLLVSGEPYPGERTWRNLLTSDASVDLVHFTILRPPQKQDGVPVSELSLIAFPTRELFMEKIDEFDLIIFDRYRRRGVLPDLYLENAVRYVREGGAILLVAGPAFAEVESLARSPMREILPTLPTGRVIEEGFAPRTTETGTRHPVTAGLSEQAQTWGRWFRLIDTKPRAGHVVMEGAKDKPLLVLDRVDKGRIAVLASDHAWLWSRGVEGGGPQLELLRRLAHWLMQEPELEEEQLSATAIGSAVKVTRRSLGDPVPEITFTGPTGDVGNAVLAEIEKGHWQAEFTADADGVYRITDGTLNTVVAIGPASPKEFEQPVGVSPDLQHLINSTGGGQFALAAGTPDIRRIREGRPTKGNGWLGLPRRGAYTVDDIRLTPLAPGWLILVLVAMLTLAAWRIEGK